MIATELERCRPHRNPLCLRKKHCAACLPFAGKAAAVAYGENPHQAAALYIPRANSNGLAPPNSFRAKSFPTTTMWIWKRRAALRRVSETRGHHQAQQSLRNGEQQTLREAYLKPMLATHFRFGGVLAFNREVDAVTPRKWRNFFVECIAASGFDARAKEIFAPKRICLLLELPAAAGTERNCN